MTLRSKRTKDMKSYTNPFHNGHLYLKIGEAEADAIRPSQFDELIETHRKPLQVMVPSGKTRLIGLLLRSGFVLKRRCYETEAGAEDLILPMTDDFDPLPTAERGTPAYERCAALMFRYYAETHRPVNPLTATEPEFFAILPDLALYETTNGRVSCAAFVEDDEIAYVCSDDRSAFPAFARALVCTMLKRHESICFEADDVDWAATELRGLFSVKGGESFDTYVKPLPARIDERTYLADPCGASSLPFWKTEQFAVPDGVTVLRDDAFRETKPDGMDEPYFKLMHDLKNVDPPSLPPRFETVACGAADYAAHINACYAVEGVTEEELASCTRRPTYDPSLWIAVRDRTSGRIAATGIAELDARIGEGILEWIQVSPDCRRKGLGRFVVNELLRRMQGKASFCTVSGKRNDPCDPLALYRSCGFQNMTVWHVIKKVRNGMKKQVILLNGPSGSGKSTLAKTLRERIAAERGERYAIVSIDDFMRITTDEPIYEDDVFEISGEMCGQIQADLCTFDGVIVDHVITSARIFEQLKDSLRGRSLFAVHVTCPLAELERRERARGDRHPGTAEASYTYLYPKDGYDLTLDTSGTPLEACADAILAAVFSPAGTTDDR